jgi:RecA-family ATPase
VTREDFITLDQHRAQQQRAARRPLIRAISAAELGGRPLPSRRWVVPGWIPDRAVTLLGGDGGTGKSLLALQLMAACAAGRPWLGMGVDRRPAFALFCEDDADEVHLRLDAICRREGLGYDGLAGLHFEARSGMANVLLSFASDNSGSGEGRRAPLWQELVQTVRERGARLVIIDTLADVFAGNENFRGQARAFINMMRELANAIDGAVVVTAHPSVAGQSSGTGLSGSTAWNNSVRSRLYLTRPPVGIGDHDERLLKRMKANYAGAGDELKLRWEKGVFVRPEEPTWIERRAANDRIDRRFLELLATLEAQGRTVSDKTGRNYAPVIMARMPGAGATRRGFEDAMARLFHANRIRAVQKGPPSRAISIIKSA